jgi:ribose transport system substrate-binding protein
MRYRRTVTIALSLALAALLAACGSDSGGGSGGSGSGGSSGLTAESLGIPQTGDMVDTAKWKKSGPWTIGYADASMSNSWRVFAWQYLQYGASQLPDTKVIHTNANDSTPKQVADIQDLVARNVDCLIVAATSADALSPVIGAASKKVPVVVEERAVSTDQYTTFASLDAVQMGQLQAQAVVDALQGQGNVLIMQGVAGSGPVVQSLQGMRQVLTKNPGIKVLNTVYTDWSRDKGKTAMENALQAFPRIDAVLSDSGLQAAGAFEAAKAAGRLNEIKAWSGDTDQTWMRLVHSNKLPGIIVDRPTKVGEQAAKLCGAILSGIPVPKVVSTPNQVIKPADLAKYIAPNTPGSGQWWDWWNLPQQWLPKSG